MAQRLPDPLPVCLELVIEARHSESFKEENTSEIHILSYCIKKHARIRFPGSHVFSFTPILPADKLKIAHFHCAYKVQVLELQTKVQRGCCFRETGCNQLLDSKE